MDYGSSTELAAAYRDLCREFAWRYIRVEPPERSWSLSAAYNTAVALLDPQVTIVFKNDVDVLLGENVLETASRLGKDRYCVFPVLAAGEETCYPEGGLTQEALGEIAEQEPGLEPMSGEGIHAYPRKWFEEMGGFDLTFKGWGYQESDLRFRATNSIGRVIAEDALLIHQWHPINIDHQQARKNRSYYESTKDHREIVRNNGKLFAPLETLKPTRRTCSKATRRTRSTRITIPSEARLTVAVGRENIGAGSWDWLGVDLMSELSKYFRTVPFRDTIPECDVLLVVKFSPAAHVLNQISNATALIYCPVDLFFRAEDITASSEMLSRYGRIIVHCERLREHFQPYSKVEYFDHHVKYVVPDSRTFQTEGSMLWIGWQTMLPALVSWANQVSLPMPLSILTTPDPGTPLLTSPEMRFNEPDKISVEHWSPERHRELTRLARCAVDIKGTDFHQQHKPATKALDFIASGIPTAVNHGSSVAEQLGRLGFEVADPFDFERWLSEEYFEETARFAGLLREMLSLERVAIRWKRIIEDVAQERHSKPNTEPIATTVT